MRVIINETERERREFWKSCVLEIIKSNGHETTTLGICKSADLFLESYDLKFNKQKND